MKPLRSVFHRCRRRIRSCRHIFVNQTSLLTDHFLPQFSFLSPQSAKEKLKRKRKQHIFTTFDYQRMKLSCFLLPPLLPEYDCADNNTQQLCLSSAKRVLCIICASDSFSSRYCDIVLIIFCILVVIQFEILINDLLNLIDRSKNSSARISTDRLLFQFICLTAFSSIEQLTLTRIY